MNYFSSTIQGIFESVFQLTSAEAHLVSALGLAPASQSGYAKILAGNGNREEFGGVENGCPTF